MMLLAIDPGTMQSGWCYFHGNEKRVLYSGVDLNGVVLKMCKDALPIWDDLVIEMIHSMGMAVGQSTFETVRWIGRFQQAWRDPDKVRLVYRRDVKLHLCGSMKAKDPNVWQALIDKLGPVGTKAEPGPLYGVKSHARSAVAVAVTAAETVPIFEGAVEE